MTELPPLRVWDGEQPTLGDSTETWKVIGEESARLAALTALCILDSPAEPRFDDLTALAARLCATPIALVSLIDADRVWFKSRIGTDLTEVARTESFCTRAMDRSGILIVPDASADPAYASHTVVAGEPWIRFYAGVPLVSASGFAYGTLCVLDTVARTLTDVQQADLTTLARLVLRELEADKRTRELEANLAAKTAAEESLRETQQLLQSILDNADAMIHAKDLDGRFILANRALQQTIGKPGSAMLGQNAYQVFPDAQATQFMHNDAVIAAIGERKVFDEELLSNDGRLLSLRSTKFPLADSSGKIFAVGGVSLDVTELREVGAALAKSEQRWRALAQTSPSAVTVVAADGRITYANAQSAQLFGVENERAMVGRLALDFIPGGDQEMSRQWFRNVLQHGPPTTGETIVLERADAQRLIVECHAGVLTFNGEPAVQLEMRDVSAQSAALKELRQSEQRFRAIFDHSPVAMALSDEDGLWVEVNDAFAQLIGVDHQRMLGASALKYAHPEDHVLIAASERGQQDSPDGVLRMEVRFVRPSGAIRWAWLSITPIDGPNGEKWTLAIAQDVTERKLAETAMRESEEDLAAIAAVARCVQTGGDFRSVVVSSLLSLCKASTAVLLEAGDDNDLVVTASAGIDLKGYQINLAEVSVNAQVWRSGKPVFLADAAASPLANQALLAMDDTVSALWHPIVVDGVVMAVLNATWRVRMPGLSHRAVRAALMISDEAGASLHADALRIELERAATTDPLTGALNRRAWESRIRVLMNALESTPSTFAVALIDLDFFKAFNDAHGHTAGDLVLRDFSAHVQSCIREGDLFARWGGEEFILALRDCAPDHIRPVINRIRDGVPYNLTCSIGYTTWNRSEEIGVCISRADVALYDAKRNGRNQVAAR